jgi:predicted  nucleic acid-binding Zn-ribbon protein
VSDDKKTPPPRRQTKEEVSALARAAADAYQGIPGADQRSPREQLEAKLASARAKLQSEHDRFARYTDDDPRRLKYNADIQWATSKVRILEEQLQRLKGEAAERP